MLENAWTTARAWAAEARRQQGSARKQALWTFVLAALAALLAAVVGAAGESATIAGATPPAAGTLPIRWTTIVSLTAGFLAALGALWGRYVQQGSAERKWIAARAAAEFVQSECYRYAGGVTPYDGKPAEAAALLDRKVSAASRSAREAGAMPGEGAPSSSRPGPAAGMDAAWYRQHRLMQQRDFYREASQRHARAADRLRRTAFGFGVAAALLGFLGAVDGLAFLAAGVGAVTTIAGGVAAYSNVERHMQLAARYSEMAEAVASLLGRHEAGLLTDAALVDESERLLTAEYAAWQQHMLKQSPAPG
jgi:conflict system pore-forming effector with SLATT domain/uncharacterized protein DUF4231